MSLYHRRAEELKVLGFRYDRILNCFRRGNVVLPMLSVLTSAVDRMAWHDFVERIKEKLEENQ